MSAGEVEGETGAPNWLRELEEKRERRVKARLGHEAGAGSPCLECKDKCPGLDLHFWRKICKNCRCGKENHDVQDDDVHGFVQHTLLGSKPKKPSKFVIPGKNGEVELEWAPKGSKEAVERYLKDLPPELLPIKGSSAAQERKQLLQKQIPVHDVDPSLCHALTEEETRQMNEYISLVKEKSVGVGILTNVGAKATLVSSRVQEAVAPSENKVKKHSRVSEGLIKGMGRLGLDDGGSRHDYENIDVFGKHKLEASLEEIERMQNVGVDEGWVNPPYAQYAMLLDKSNAPLKDRAGNPVQAKLDVYGNPIFDHGVMEKLSGKVPAFAMLLDKNCAPILDDNGSPLKNRVRMPDEVKVDKHRQYALLLDPNHAPVKDKFGSPIRVGLDVFGAPMLERGLSEVVAAVKPEFACFLDKNGAPIVDKYGNMATYNLNQLMPKSGEVGLQDPKYALLLDKYRSVIVNNGEEIVAKLDRYGRPVLTDAIIESLGLVKPQYALLLDAIKAPILDRHGQTVQRSLNVFDEPILDKFGNEIRPKYGLLLDKHESPLKDQSGIPVRVLLDGVNRPIIDEAVVEKIGARRPEFVMFLDRNGAPILDKYGSPVKNIVGTNQTPMYGVLLDGRKEVIRDGSGVPIEVRLDAGGKAVINDSVAARLAGVRPRYVRFLDEHGVPVLDEFGNGLQEFVPEAGNAKYAVLTDKNETPLVDRYNEPITVNLDPVLNPIINKSVLERLGTQSPSYAVFLDNKGHVITDAFGYPMKEKLHDFATPVCAVLLSESNEPVIGSNGAPVIVKLDDFERAIIDDECRGAGAKYSVPLDYRGVPIFDKGKEILQDSNILLGTPVKGVLLDGNGKVINNQQPIFADLDRFRRPILNEQIIEQLKHQKPQFVVYYDSSGSPMRDRHGKYAKAPVFKYTPYTTKPNQAIICDQHGEILDVNGEPIHVPLSSTGHPLVDPNLAVNNTKNPLFLRYLDPSGSYLLDTSGQPLTDPMANYLDDYKQPLLDKYGNPIDIENATLMDKNGRPILDKYGTPVQVKVDPFGRPILREMDDYVNLDKTILVDKQGRVIQDENNKGVLLKNAADGTLRLHNTGLQVYDGTGQPIRSNTLQQMTPLQRYDIPEDITNPTPVNIGIIRDLDPPVHKPQPHQYQTTHAQNHETYDAIPQCHRCKHVFNDNELAIQIERSEAMWHSQCFKCAGCNQNLADLVYFYHVESDDIYCGRDFAKIRGIPRCNACDELIFVKEYCLANDETYHIKHFCCFECDIPLAGQQYVMESSQPVCISCFEKLKADKCISCNSIIKPDEQGANLNGNHFHADDVCFACKSCRKPLLGIKFLFRNSKLYCSGQCYNIDQ